MSKPIKTKKNRVEKTKRTEQMKHPRRCVICAITKDADKFCRYITYLCTDCFEKPPKPNERKA
jgi:hypothetical protein